MSASLSSSTNKGFDSRQPAVQTKQAFTPSTWQNNQHLIPLLGQYSSATPLDPSINAAFNMRACHSLRNIAADTFSHKMSLVVRMDLKMGRGKIAAQCSHAAVSAYASAAESKPSLVHKWMACGQPKVALKAANLEEM